MKDLKTHKDENNSCQGTFQCEECEKCFKNEQKLEDHIGIHKKYPCEIVIRYLIMRQP